MHVSTVFILSVIILEQIPVSESKSLTVLNIFKAVFDIFKPGFKIIDAIRKQNSGFIEDVKTELERVRKDIDRMVRISTTEIIREITLQNKLDKIETTVYELKSLLIDLKNYVLAENTLDRLNYESLFLERYDQRVVAMIRSLPELLSYTVPGFSEPLADLILNHSRCNMTAIHAFQMFYVQILSDGFTLQLVFREFLQITSSDVEDFWIANLPKVQERFDSMEETCKERLPQYAVDEIKQNIDVDVMFEQFKERYTWAWSDVFYYPPMGTYQFHYHKAVKDCMFWNGASSAGRNQILVIGDNDNNVHGWAPVEMSSALASNHETFKSVIKWSDDNSAAKKVGEAVEKFVKKKGFSIGTIIVFFDAKGLGNFSRIIDNGSLGAYVGLDGVKLKYCYSSGIACSLASWNLFNFNQDWKEYTGMFHVYVYPYFKMVKSEKGRKDSTSVKSEKGTKDSTSIKHSTSAANNILYDSSRTFITAILYIFVTCAVFND